MTFEDLQAEIRKFPFHEERTFSSQYIEVVLHTEVIPKIQASLELFFSSPLKRAGDLPSPQILRHAQPYGGIRREQTMYVHRERDKKYLAFFWPWSNGSLVTLKIFEETQQDKVSERKGIVGFFSKLFR